MSMLDTIQATLAAIERQPGLFVGARFAERADALEQLEVEVCDALRPLLAGAPGDQRLRGLDARARALQEALEATNLRLFQDLRSTMMTNTHDRQALLALFIANRERHHQHADLAYDRLDLLLSGILQLEPLPEAPELLEDEMIRFQPTPARLIVELVQRAGLGPGDVFFDLGAGLGHVALLVHLLSGARAVGVEIQPAYWAAACRSAASLNLSGVTYINQDARTADLSGGTFYYLYTPFRGALLRSVLGRLELEARQRSIQICSYGPCTATIAREPWLAALSEPGLPPTPLAIFQSRAQ
jgi:protein-L-isoaspartate O-methyltransferase